MGQTSAPTSATWEVMLDCVWLPRRNRLRRRRCSSSPSSAEYYSDEAPAAAVFHAPPPPPCQRAMAFDLGDGMMRQQAPWLTQCQQYLSLRMT